jgi:hypothetical protein
LEKVDQTMNEESDIQNQIDKLIDDWKDYE